MPNGMATVQRHPTIPLSKRDSVASNGSRISLLTNSNTSSTKKVPSQFEEKDFVNTHPEMIAGKKRPQKSPKKVKRTDSYKIATNRASAFDNLDEDSDQLGDLKSNVKVTISKDRKKYNTLPIKPNGNTCSHPSQNTDSRRSKDTGGGSATGKIARTDSSKSATYMPSPDTDDDQRSTQPDRKKKSAFKKMKERLVSTFQRPDRDPKSQKGKHKVSSTKESVSRGFVTPGGDSQRSKSSSGSNRSFTQPDVSVHHTHAERKGGIIQSFPNSSGRKHSHDRYQNDSHETRSSNDTATFTTARVPPAERQPQSVDPFTEIFNTLIDPDRPKADRSRLRLDGLHVCRPAGGDQVDGQHTDTDLQTDGKVDGEGYSERGLSFSEASEAEKQRRIDEVGTRLAAIGDSVSAEFLESGSGSELTRPETDFDVHSLRRELQAFGDDLDKTLFKTDGKGISVDVWPIIKGIVKAQNYRSFAAIIKREISDTVGWQEVAWYTFLVKTAVVVAGTGSTVRQYACQYFSRNLRPFVASRPKGWESIHEETDLDSELD